MTRASEGLMCQHSLLRFVFPGAAATTMLARSTAAMQKRGACMLLRIAATAAPGQSTPATTASARPSSS